MEMKRLKLKKRLRKKLHVGEFQELCFEINAQLKTDLNETDFDKFVDDFILEAIERNQLEFGGGGNPEKWNGFASLSKKYGSPTDNHREKVRNWLEKRAEVVEYEIGNLRDAWYGWK